MYFKIHLMLNLLIFIFHIVIQPSFGETNPVPNTTAIYQTCHAQTSLCYGFPENCVSSSNCQFIFRSQFDPKLGFHFDLTAPSISTANYIAVGFTNNSIMSGLVVQCSSKSGQSAIQYSFNEYSKRHNSPIPNQNDVSGFTNLESSYQDGQLQCRWQAELPAKVRYHDILYDFEQNKFYVQLATGEFDGEIQYHGTSRETSKSSVSLKSTSTIQSEGLPIAIRWHASLMIFGWIGCMTVAILMARFTRDLWPDQKLLGQKYWFVAHRSLMVVGWLAIVGSYVINFVHYKGWSKTSAHSVIGAVAGILATLQIGNSFLRPAPDSAKRWIFDYAHWAIGNTAHLLAIANIIEAGLKQSIGFFWLLIAYLFVYLLFSDLLRKLENRVRLQNNSIAIRVFQMAILFGIGIIVGITAALVVIMISQ